MLFLTKKSVYLFCKSKKLHTFAAALETTVSANNIKEFEATEEIKKTLKFV